jgi:uncharacterized protein YndB with AHSA1/START domain
MSGTTQHSSFVIERTLDATPARVFAAFAEPQAKAAWFRGPDGWTVQRREHDFRVGGRERVDGRFPDGNVSSFDCRFSDIVPGRRIVYTYDMRVNDTLISVSVATIELEDAGGGRTHLKCTEQGAFLNGYDDAGSRERGTGGLIDRLASTLAEG